MSLIVAKIRCQTPSCSCSLNRWERLWYLNISLLVRTGHITSYKSSVYRNFAWYKKWRVFVFPPWKFSSLTKSEIFILKISLVCKLFLRTSRCYMWCFMPRFCLKTHTLNNIFTNIFIYHVTGYVKGNSMSFFSESKGMWVSYTTLPLRVKCPLIRAMKHCKENMYFS